MRAICSAHGMLDQLPGTLGRYGKSAYAISVIAIPLPRRCWDNFQKEQPVLPYVLKVSLTLSTILKRR